MSPGGYGWMNYQADRRLIAGFERLQENYRMDPSAPWELEARSLLKQKRARVRTGPGHETAGSGASFSPVSDYDVVSGSQVYAVLVKEVDAAQLRAQDFRRMNNAVGKDSPLEKIVAAIHVAEIDGATARAEGLTYLLGQRLLGMPWGEKARVERRIVGHSLYNVAVGAVQPALF